MTVPGKLKNKISAIMRNVRRDGGLPTSTQIVRETFQRLKYTADKLEPEYVLHNFNTLLFSVWKETLVTLEYYENQSYSIGIPMALMREFPEEIAEAEKISMEKGFKAGVLNLFQNWYLYLRMAFLSVSQSRKTRGGRDFELQTEMLLDLAKITYTRQERQNRTDLIIPNVEIFEMNKNIAMVVSLKRTLRERWAEVAEELFNLRSPNVFLFTADTAITRNHIKRICGDYNIHLVVWDSVKKKFLREHLVVGYSEWAINHLSILRDRWRRYIK